MGTDLLIVRPAETERSPGRRQIRGAVTTLTLGDSAALARLPVVAQVLPGVDRPLRVKAGAITTVANVQGTTPDFPRVRRFRLRAGRFLDETDEREARRVAVLGARVAERLFDAIEAETAATSPEPILGRTIRLRGIPFEIVGLLEAKGVQADGSDEDNLVAIPLRTALRRLFNVPALSTLFVRVRDAGEPNRPRQPHRMEEAQKAIGDLLRERHRLTERGRPDDFAIQDRTKVLASRKETVETLTLFTGGLSALALFLGGVGILALLLLSIRERRSEIGLRMAVGARPRDVLLQFLAEAAALSLGGWLAGAAFGALGIAALAFGTSWEVALPFRALLVSLALVLATGLGFGVFPARRASLLPPVRALAAD
jgi:putative ABC transport system permease protein